MCYFSTDGEFIRCIDNDLNRLKVPFSLTIACDGRMVVCDSGDKSVKVLSPEGTELFQSFSVPDCDDSPWEVIFHEDKFFVSYPTACCVKAFDKDGKFLYDIGNANSDQGKLRKPRGLTIKFVIRLSSTLTRPKGLMEETVYDTFRHRFQKPL